MNSPALCTGDMSDRMGANPLKLFLDVVLKLNSAFITARDLQDILNAVLVGITAGEGLGFNRAFLFTVNKEEGLLEGTCGLGPKNPEDAAAIWEEISTEGMTLFDIMEKVKQQLSNREHPLNRLARSIKVSLDDTGNCLIQSLESEQALLVSSCSRENAVYSPEMCGLFGTDEFAVAPIYTHGEEYGVVVADNVFTKVAIDEDKLYALHLFTGLASLAICQSNVCRMLEEKVERLRQVNEAVESQKSLLVETEKYSAIGQMVENLLHELRNPVTSIGGIVKLLEKREEDEKKRRYLNSVIREVQKIEDTLNKVAEVHDIGPLDKEDFDLVFLVDMTLALIHSELEEVGIALYKNYSGGSIRVKGDREKLQQAILCIMKNSVEAMPDGGILVIGMAKKGADVELRISDSGLGIARGHFKKAHSPFFTTKLNALGLGLSKAKKIVELHDGYLNLMSNRIGGTTCVISIPRIIEE